MLYKVFFFLGTLFLIISSNKASSWETKSEEEDLPPETIIKEVPLSSLKTRKLYSFSFSSSSFLEWASGIVKGSFKPSFGIPCTLTRENKTFFLHGVQGSGCLHGFSTALYGGWIKKIGARPFMMGLKAGGCLLGSKAKICYSFTHALGMGGLYKISLRDKGYFSFAFQPGITLGPFLGYFSSGIAVHLIGGKIVISEDRSYSLNARLNARFIPMLYSGVGFKVLLGSGVSLGLESNFHKGRAKFKRIKGVAPSLGTPITLKPSYFEAMITVSYFMR